jgi:lipopolysaccharide export system protein LptC
MNAAPRRPGTPARPQRTPRPTLHAAWAWRLREALATWLPLLLMLLLALGTWWLVKSTPGAATPRPGSAATHEPDYTMEVFSVQRFTAQGRPSVRLQGERLRHFPDTDVTEVDGLRLHAVDEDGVQTQALARRAWINGDASEVRLEGGAQVTRPDGPGGAAIDMRGQALQANLRTRQFAATQPVVVRFGSGELQAERFEYDHATRVLVMKGRVRASFASPGTRGVPAPKRTAP